MSAFDPDREHDPAWPEFDGINDDVVHIPFRGDDRRTTGVSR